MRGRGGHTQDVAGKPRAVLHAGQLSRRRARPANTARLFGSRETLLL